MSETAPIPEDLMNISLEEVIFTAEWVPEVILPDNQPSVFDSSQEEIVDVGTREGAGTGEGETCSF